MTTQIYDTSCKKIRTVKKLKVSSYEETDKNGNVQLKKSVEFIVIGKNRQWKMLIPYDDFVTANPDVVLPGESK